MKRSRFSDEQIIAIVKEQEAGMATAEVCRRHGISGATFYKWKSKYGGQVGAGQILTPHKPPACPSPLASTRRRFALRYIDPSSRHAPSAQVKHYRKTPIQTGRKNRGDVNVASSRAAVSWGHGPSRPSQRPSAAIGSSRSTATVRPAVPRPNTDNRARSRGNNAAGRRGRGPGDRG